MSHIFDVSGLPEFLRGISPTEEPYRVLKAVQSRMMILNPDYHQGGAVGLISLIRPDLAEKYEGAVNRLNSRNQRMLEH